MKRRNLPLSLADRLALDVPEACRVLALSERTLRALVARGGIPFTRIGGSLRFQPDRLRAWLTANETTPAGMGDVGHEHGPQNTEFSTESAAGAAE
jgi:excisionase family DNA binding protein